MKYHEFYIEIIYDKRKTHIYTYDAFKVTMNIRNHAKKLNYSQANLLSKLVRAIAKAINGEKGHWKSKLNICSPTLPNCK